MTQQYSIQKHQDGIVVEAVEGFSLKLSIEMLDRICKVARGELLYTGIFDEIGSRWMASRQAGGVLFKNASQMILVETQDIAICEPANKE